MSDAYRQFLEQKIRFDHASGFEIDSGCVNPKLKPHQRDIVCWAVRGGCRAIFASFGLGKTFMQIEIVRIMQPGTGLPGLIVLPLGVRQEFMRDGKTLGVNFKFIRTADEMTAGHNFYLTNYESIRDGKLDPNLFGVVSLDEASVLRGYGTKTYQTFLQLFDQVQYKFVATATPSPNRYKELIHYAGFLGILDTGQALTRWFKRDPSKAGNLTLHPHKEAEFWLWLNSWAAFIQKPSDLGYSDEGYELPRMTVHYHEVKASHDDAGEDRDGQKIMFRDAALGLKDAAREKRDTLPLRIEKMLEIVGNDPDSHYLLWHDLEDERRAIKKALPAAVEVYGSQDLDIREQNVIDFSDGKIQYLATKPELSGSGCNFQKHCHKAIFLGIGYKFNDFIQSIHRIYRFLQQYRCEIHIIYADTEYEILKTLQHKWTAHNLMVDRMSELIREHGLNSLSLAEPLKRTIGVERIEASGHGWRVANNDCVDETKRMETNSMGLIVTSIPFANHYEYTASYNDFGHTDDNDHFWRQMDFLTPELYRVLMPGRIAAIHVKDRILFGNVTKHGFPSCDMFHEETSLHFRKHGFVKIGMITVETDVVRENSQTYRLGWTEQCKDGSKMGVGCSEYIYLFRKPQTDQSRAYADLPVMKSKEEYTRGRWQVDAHGKWRSSGNRLLTPEELANLPEDIVSKVFTEWSLQNVYDYEQHVKIAEELDNRKKLPSGFSLLKLGSHHPFIWHDVNRMITLNGEQTKRGLENHICPLQFDVVDRLIVRYSNKGEPVYDPFGGLFTVPYRAILLGRIGRAAELKTSYFYDGTRMLKLAEQQKSIPDLFACLEEEDAA